MFENVLVAGRLRLNQLLYPQSVLVRDLSHTQIRHFRLRIEQTQVIGVVAHQGKARLIGNHHGLLVVALPNGKELILEQRELHTDQVGSPGNGNQGKLEVHVDHVGLRFSVEVASHHIEKQVKVDVHQVLALSEFLHICLQKVCVLPRLAEGMDAFFNEDAVPFVALGPLLDPQQLAHQRTPLIQEDVGLSKRLEQVRGVLVLCPSHEVARI